MNNTDKFDEYDKCLKVFCFYCERLVNADDTKLTIDDELQCQDCQDFKDWQAEHMTRDEYKPFRSEEDENEKSKNI